MLLNEGNGLIQHALARRDGKKHTVDMRLTMKIPMVPVSFYLVMLGGKNRRTLSNNEKWFAGFMFLAFITVFVSAALTIGLLALYLAKSALGIDLLPDSSTGIWDWFKSL